MKTINLGDRVKYIGEPNRWTFSHDLEKNIIGKVVEISNTEGKTIYKIGFDNGIITPIDLKDLLLES